MAYEMVMPYHLHMPSYFLETFTEYPYNMTAKTGEKCPVSGVWKVDGFPTTTAPIAKGNTMPPYCGKAVTWRLIQYA